MARIIDFDTGEPRDAPEEKGAPISADEYVKHARPIEWVVQDRIAVRASTIIAGKAKYARKTLLALHLAQCVGRGALFLGHEALKRQVIVTCFEGGRGFIGQRVIEVGHSAALGDEVRAPIDFADGIEGYDWTINRMSRRSEAREPWPILYIVDTLSQVLARKNIDENDNMAVTRYLASVDELAISTDASIFFVHHFSKQGLQMRGASAMMGICNWVEVNPIKGLESGLRLDWILRHGPGGPDFVRVQKPNGRFTFDPVDPAELPSRGSSDRDEIAREAIVAEFKSRQSESVSTSRLVEVASKAAGRKVGKRTVSEMVLFLRRGGAPITASIGGGEPGYVWRE